MKTTGDGRSRAYIQVMAAAEAPAARDRIALMGTWQRVREQSEFIRKFLSAGTVVVTGSVDGEPPFSATVPASVQQ